MSQVQYQSSSSSNSFLPNATLQEFDDFLACTFNLGYKLNWFSGGMTQTNGVQGHPGIIGAFAGANNSFIILSDGGGTSRPVILGSGSYSVSFVFNNVALSTAGNRYTFNIGLVDTTTAEPNNGCYFQYSDNINSGNWVLKTAAGGVRTTQNSSTAAATGWQRLTVNVDATAANVTFFINGTQIGTAITTNIPVLTITPGWLSVLGAGNQPAHLVDLFYMTYTATTAR